jgi:hypothetical protein
MESSVADVTKLPQPGAGCIPAGISDERGTDAFVVRFGTATQQAVATGTVAHTPNGDEKRYADKSGTYSKALLQKTYGVVDPGVFHAFRFELGDISGTGNGNFENAAIIRGGDRKLNGPRAAFAYTLAGGDSTAFGDLVVPPAPDVASLEYAAELIELYWASLLRDVPFESYPHSQTAKEAADELDSLAAYKGPRDAGGKVTPHVLFRGGFGEKAKAGYFPGEAAGPYISQLCIQPTMLGQQPIDQKLHTYVAALDYMKTLDAWQAVQNGVTPATVNVVDSELRYMHNGRAIAAFTHVDELYQAYLTAYLVIKTLGIGPNPGSPYLGYTNDQPFGTFGGPDVAATLGAVAKIALNAVWYQKWIVHLRHRPESGGGIVHLMQTGQGNTIDAHVDPSALGSKALQRSFERNGSYLLSQAFPEGSPTHPAYPTGHGTVAGACITVLKFFFNGFAGIPNAVVPSADGLRLEPYAGNDAEAMTLNGELNKLAHNISFGHGIHAGIHWRSDTDYSILLGEAVALRFLQDHAFTYQEDFSIQVQLLDGTLSPPITNH